MLTGILQVCLVNVFWLLCLYDIQLLKNVQVSHVIISLWAAYFTSLAKAKKFALR